MRMKLVSVLITIMTVPLVGQTLSQGRSDPWAALNFLQGTWEAKAKGATGAVANGTYTFQNELGNHVLARHSSGEGCRGPADFNCDHKDLLYVYQERPDQPLKAIYFDSEGHVIYYQVSSPTINSVEFLSDSSQQGPQFRLAYELQGKTMFGKFQIRVPGQNDWKSYLEWSGSKTK